MTDVAGNIDLEEQLARIRRYGEETQKFMEDSRKLAEESRKLHAEERKLYAEERKLGSDRQLAGWQLVITGMTAGAALIGATVGATIAMIKFFSP